MNTDWHDLIQRYIAGLTTEVESAFLQDSLKRDDALARLYLRHMNLDVALEAHAASSEAMAELLNAPDAAPPGRSTRWLSWRPLTAAAACVALVLSGWLMSHFKSSRVSPEVAVAISSAEQAIAQMSVDSPLPLPEWMSPTASLLDQPRLPE